ncbi:1,2-phenylacetyl-CoA epoxidase subunit PaaD [Lederbergia citrea]|uniref:1,2-phenylacetyl-CoA epoxidase subunit PaaD n=1 Tax=Lederbergia citrea TaxID=2833581 RepID=UPI0020169432|nr:1,2-phenylacetyl-CoA epoxidase subunit PaaD [Lederbergia citrea]
MKNEVLLKLQHVKDPEIPSVSIIELGMIEEVTVCSGKVFVKALPTFVGCPALEIIKQHVHEAIVGIAGVEEVTVDFIYHPPWTSDRISEEGKKKLKEFGIAPPPVFEDGGMWAIQCPYCNSDYTTLDNLFGPTACRSILYCKSCKNPFEAMRPVSDLM